MGVPVFVLREHSFATSTWMSRGLSSAETLAASSARAVVMVANFMVDVAAEVLELKLRWI